MKRDIIEMDLQTTSGIDRPLLKHVFANLNSTYVSKLNLI